LKIKLDENLSPSLASVFGRTHDVDTVQDEGLSGASDDRLIAACQLEGRALITLDLDFASIVSYPPAQFAGIVVLRLAVQAPTSIAAALGQVVALLDREPLSGRLWIVEDNRIRILE
jgi:predicted nuclease of predicted toxin-antitoxin system